VAPGALRSRLQAFVHDHGEEADKK